MNLSLDGCCLYIKLVCIYAKHADRLDTLHYEPKTIDQYEAEDPGSPRMTSQEWRRQEDLWQQEITNSQNKFAWELGYLKEVASGKFSMLDWRFLQCVWDALGDYEHRDEELESLYEKLHQAWSSGAREWQQRIGKQLLALDKATEQAQELDMGY